MGRIDDDDIAFRIYKRTGTLQALVTHRRCRCYAQAARRILGCVGISNRFLDILNGDQANAVKIIVDDQQFFDAALMQEAPGLFLRYAGLYGCEIIARHQFRNRLHRVFSKTDVAVGKDADELSARFNHRDARNPVFQHQRLRIGKRRIWRDRDRVDDHARFIPLHLTHSCRLFLNRQIAMQHADPAQLGHHDRHARFCNGIHRR